MVAILSSFLASFLDHFQFLAEKCQKWDQKWPKNGWKITTVNNLITYESLAVWLFLYIHWLDAWLSNSGFIISLLCGKCVIFLVLDCNGYIWKRKEIYMGFCLRHEWELQTSLSWCHLVTCWQYSSNHEESKRVSTLGEGGDWWSKTVYAVEQAYVQQQWQSVKTSTLSSCVQVVLLLLTLVTIY